MDPLFAELCARSSFSFLEGASHPEEIVATAKALGLDAVALCDRDGLYGSVRAHTAAKEQGQRMIVGAELTLEPDGLGTVALLAVDHEGYGNLCALLTAAHKDHEKGEAGVLVAQVAASARGLVAVLPVDPRGRAPHDDVFGPIAEAFGERAFAATWVHRDGFDAARLAAARAAERRFGLQAVATARALYHHPSRKPLADILHCIRKKTTLDQAGAALGPNAEARLRSGAQMLTLFKDAPELVHRTVDVASACRFSLSELRYHFPSDTLCLPGESPDQALRRLVDEGLDRRYPGGAPLAVLRQIEKELGIIALLEVAPYFLSVQQIVNMARAKRILCQGRGSAANSAVCYVLGVTAVDPSRHALLFERFLSPERREPPDIDVDFEHERREEIIQEIYETHGRDRAAMVSEIIAYRGRSALREVGKAFGLSADQLDRLSGLVIHMDPKALSAERIAEAGLDPEDPRLQQILHYADELEGFPRHLSIHVGGFVISSRPLHEVAPVEPARMADRTVIPWDKDDIDELGFFKIDVLALGMLTAIRKALEMVHGGDVSQGFDPIEALAAVPHEDPRVYAAIQRADVIGVFQIESRAQMSMLPRLKPKDFYDLVIEVAIVRPGPIQGGMVHPYLRRRTGQEQPTPPHPCLEPILKRTLGVPLFQEQVMQIAMVGGGYTPGEADQLRRDMAAWKRHGRLGRHRDKLLEGFARKGIAPEFGEKLWLQVQGFGEYGFPESHAASFALLVYASAWLKTHHPAEFACALLNAQPMGFYSPSSIVKDAQRHHVEVRPPCVVASGWDSTLEPSASPKIPAIRLGLRQIRGLAELTMTALVKARREAPFASLRDLVRRAGLHTNDVEALAEAGALAPLIPARREALWQARTPREAGLFEGVGLEPDADVGLPALRPLEQLALDYGRVGLSIDDHPLKHLREGLAARGVKRARDLERMSDGAPVTVAGLVLGRQRPGTASGVTFVTLEDETGMVNLIVQAHVFAENFAVARHAPLLLAKGRVERQGRVIHVLAEALARLEMPDGEVPRTRSRDFH
jgi:error-prone DNA polymerase